MKRHTALMELTVAFAIFALSATVVLRLFSVGFEMNRHSSREAWALREAQGWAERLYAGGVGPERLKETEWRMSGNDGRLELTGDLFLNITFSQTDTETGTLHRAQLSAWEGKTLLFSLPVVRYQGDGT